MPTTCWPICFQRSPSSAPTSRPKPSSTATRTSWAAQSYYEALAAADQSGDLIEWLEYFVQGIAVEMVRLEQRITALGQIVRQAPGTEAAAFGLNSRQIRALEFLLREPRLTTALYVQLNRVSRATAQRDLADLVARGLLRRRGVGRGIHYVLPEPDKAQTPPDEAQKDAQNGGVS